MQELTELTPAACRALLGTGGQGRVVFTEDALPAVAPTVYLLEVGRLWFPVPQRGALRRHRDGDVLAYHVDEVDPAAHTGWSVTAVGSAWSVPAADRPAQVRTAWHDVDQVLALELGRLTGRSLQGAPRAVTRTT